MLNDKGFTLIELLVALALLVILSGALYGTYFSVTAAREKGGSRIEARRELSTTLGTLHDELASTYASSNRPPNKLVQFIVEDRDSFGKPASLLAFTSVAPPRLSPAPTSDQTQVIYSVKEKEGVLTLMRESRDLYLDPGVKTFPYPVMDTVEGFLVECNDGNKWVKSWNSDPSLNGHPPRCVRVTLTLKGGEVYTVIVSPRMAQ
jgi:general secretion pathway protein J